MLRKNTALVFSFLPIVLGIYLIFNEDFLNVYGTWYEPSLNWIDDSIFGVTLIALGIFLLFSFMSRNLKIQSVGLVFLGADLFAISMIYFYRWIIGFPNFTWIFSMALFLLIYTSILRIGDRKNE